MLNFKSTFVLVLLCCTVSLNLIKAEDNDTPLTCDEGFIDMSRSYLEHYKQVYDLIEMPSFDEKMKNYEEVLKDFRKYHHYLVDNCPESNHTYYGEYLARHTEMEECVKGFLTDEDEKMLKCLLLKDQSNVDYMVHKVVSNSTEGFETIMNYCTIESDMAHKTLVFKALSQELNMGPDNYERLYFRIKKYLQEMPLSPEEHAGLCQVLKNLLWSTSKSRPITSFHDIMADIHNFNSTLEENLVQYLIEEAIKKKVDVSQILSFLGHVPCETSKIRAFVYICKHIDGYSDKSDIHLQLAYVMKAIKEGECYKKIDDAELLSSLTAVSDALPSFAKEYFVSGKLCLSLASKENQESERVFLVDGNQYLFTHKEDGITTICDFAKVAKGLFHKEAPPKDLVGDMKCEVGDFQATGEHGVNCSLNMDKQSIFACDDQKYVVEGRSEFYELHNLAEEQLMSSIQKWRENCIGFE